MTLEEVKQLLDAAVADLKADYKTQLDAQAQATAASLKEIRESIPKPAATEGEKGGKPEGDLTLASLQNQVETLNKQLAEKDKVAFNASRNEAIAALAGKSKSTNPAALQKLFLTQYGEAIKQENGSWFVTGAKGVQPLDKAFEEYLASDEGKYFLPADPQLVGSDTKETQNPSPQADGKKGSSAADQLFAAIE
jgi:DNA-binding transcriptional MerR regulator